MSGYLKFSDKGLDVNLQVKCVEKIINTIDNMFMMLSKSNTFETKINVNLQVVRVCSNVHKISNNPIFLDLIS